MHSYFVCQVRENQVGYWFVDGQSYFSAVYDVIDMAQVNCHGTAALFMCLFSYMTISQEEVYITDWWLSPEVYLKRGHEVEPGSQADYRLDKLLKKKAVRIFKCHERCNVFAYTLLPP